MNYKNLLESLSVALVVAIVPYWSGLVISNFSTFIKLIIGCFWVILFTAAFYIIEKEN